MTASNSAKTKTDVASWGNRLHSSFTSARTDFDPNSRSMCADVSRKIPAPRHRALGVIVVVQQRDDQLFAVVLSRPDPFVQRLSLGLRIHEKREAALAKPDPCLGQPLGRIDV